MCKISTVLIIVLGYGLGPLDFHCAGYELVRVFLFLQGL